MNIKYYFPLIIYFIFFKNQITYCIQRNKNEIKKNHSFNNLSSAKTNISLLLSQNNGKKCKFIFNESNIENIPEGQNYFILLNNQTNSYQLMNKKDSNTMLIKITNIFEYNIIFKLLKKNSTEIEKKKPIISFTKINDKLIYKIIGLVNYIGAIIYIFRKHSNSSFKNKINKKNDLINIKFKLYQEDYETNNFPLKNTLIPINNYSIYLSNDTINDYNFSFILKEIYFKRNKNTLKKKKFLLKLRKNEEQKIGNKNDENTTEDESSDDDKTNKKKSKWWIILIILIIILIIVLVVLFIFRKHIFKRKVSQPVNIGIVKETENTPYDQHVRIEFKEK